MKKEKYRILEHHLTGIDVNRSAYEIELFEKVKEINDDSQKLIDGWNRLKNLPYSNEHKALFNAMKSFVDYCG